MVLAFTAERGHREKSLGGERRSKVGLLAMFLPAKELDTTRQQVRKTRLPEQKRTRVVEGTTIFTFTPILNHIITIINNFRP